MSSILIFLIFFEFINVLMSPHFTDIHCIGFQLMISFTLLPFSIQNLFQNFLLFPSYLSPISLPTFFFTPPLPLPWLDSSSQHISCYLLLFWSSRIPGFIIFSFFFHLFAPPFSSFPKRINYFYTIYFFYLYGYCFFKISPFLI